MRMYSSRYENVNYFMGMIVARWVLCNCTYGCRVFMCPSSGFCNLTIFFHEFKVKLGVGVVVSVSYKFQGILQLMILGGGWLIRYCMYL